MASQAKVSKYNLNLKLTNIKMTENEPLKIKYL